MDPAYLSAALANAAVFTWFACATIALRQFIKQGYNIGFSLFLSLFLGPLAWLFSSTNKKKSLNSPSLLVQSNRRAASSWPVVLIGFSLISLLIFLTIIIYSKLFSASGEQFHTPLAQVFLLGGIVTGFVMSARSKRMSFAESLLVTALVALLPLIFSSTVSGFFSFGTAPAYYIVILFSGSILLFIGLILGCSLGYLFYSEGKFSLSFSYESLIGKRFLLAKRGAHAISVITVISIFAVMIGTAGMIVVMSVMNGFSGDIKKAILGTQAHMLVQKYGQDFTEYKAVIERTKDIPGILGASPLTMSELLLSSDVAMSGAMLFGVDIETISVVNELENNLVEGKLDYLAHPELVNEQAVKNDEGEDNDEDPESDFDNLPGIIVGRPLAQTFKVNLGDTVNVVSLVGDLGPTGPIPKMRPFKVVGIFASGMQELDAKLAYIALPVAQKFFNLKDTIHAIQYKTDNIYDLKNVSNAIQAALGGYPYYVRDWTQMNRPMFSALKLEKIVMNIILAAIIFMACLLILVTLVMVVIEKGKEIAILKSIGATDASIMKIFVTYGLIIGGLGSLLGAFLGLSLCGMIYIFGIGMDPEIYYISKIPVHVDPTEVILVVVSVVIVSFLSTIPPSLFAARLKPVEGLRYE